MLSGEKQKTQKVIVVFFLESLTWQRIYTLLISEEWFCIRLLQVTRYTDPGDIWRKLKLRGEDTGSAAPSTSSDGKPDEESRLNVRIPSFFSFFCTSILPPVRLVRRIWSYLSVSLRQNRNKLLFISNGNRTEWSTIQGVIGQVISRTRTIWNSEPDYTKSYYQLVKFHCWLSKIERYDWLGASLHPAIITARWL